MTVDVKSAVASYISRHRLLDSRGRHIVALSGGADSVALLLILLDLGYTVAAAHCNFHLRGSESDRDEQFVRSLCMERGVPFHVAHFDTAEYATLHKVSIEMAARELRYRYFEQLRRDIGAADICVAHHSDDSVETLLMNLVRGTGIHGLAGIRPVNGYVRRPLLCISRADIESYLASVGQTYVTDSTNLVDDVIRNKFRLNVIPLLASINPKASENISRTAEYVQEAVRVFDAAMADARQRIVEPCGGDIPSDTCVTIGIARLLSEPSPEYLLHVILGDYGFTSAQTGQVYANLSAPSGRVWSSADFDLLVDRGRVVIEPHRAAMRPVRVIEPGTYVFGHDERRLRVSLHDIDSDFVLSRSASVASLDADKVSFPLTLRPVLPGDRFVPFGMRGSKLVSDYLTDRKRTLFEKRRALVVTDAGGRVIWLVGERPDNDYCISGKSRRAMVLSVS